MTNTKSNELIIVRSLTDSDLGLFAAHRPTTQSKQRALNINSTIAQQLLSAKVIEAEGAHIPCRIIFGNNVLDSKRHFGKVGKNWRLGGNKIDGSEFLELDSRDFALIRSVENNDGSELITVLFVSRRQDRFNHARIVRLIEPTIKDSMEIFREGSAGFDQLSILFPSGSEGGEVISNKPSLNTNRSTSIPPMPRSERQQKNKRTIKEKIQSPYILEQMFKVSGDLSASEQTEFIKNVQLLAVQLREALLATNRILLLKKDHSKIWNSVKGKAIGFVDGGLANLSALGSTPIAARVGGYVVRPGDRTPEREKFITLKKLINELFTSEDGGVYKGSFPDISALRDAARISIEAAGAVHLLKDYPSTEFIFLHGALVNPVSRYTDIMRDGKPAFRFPNFSSETMSELLPNVSPSPTGRDSNFISVYLNQLNKLKSAEAFVCGVIEREATTSSVTRAILNNLEDHIIAPILTMPPQIWKEWFKNLIDPGNDSEDLGARITDTLLLRCVLEPGEVLLPVKIDRNEMRRAPQAWHDVIINYPQPMVSYLKTSEWSAPIRLEIFEKDINCFESIADLVFHCSLLLPRYSFPAGLDIVDKFAKIPDWMSKPINTNIAVLSLKNALFKGDEKLFDFIRRMLCGSTREWFLRPGTYK